jgi:hypothetical protein
MRFRALSFAAVVLAGAQVINVHGQTPGLWHASSLSGGIVSPICSSDNFATGDASGDLSGSFAVAFDCKDGEIASGTWLVVVTGPGPDGTTAELGTISGRVLHGSYQADSAGNQVVVRDVELAITQGTDAYASVASGTGTLEATSDVNASPQFLGTLRLSF